MSKRIIENYIIDNEDSGLRADIFLSNIFADLSRSYIQKQIKSGCILVNDVQIKPSQILKTDDLISIDINTDLDLQIPAQNIPLDIKYEDEQMLVVNKPSGMLTHPTSVEKTDTLVNALLYYTNGQLSDCNGINRPGIVHRLDRNTSGLLMIAKTNYAYEYLKNQVQQRTIEKKYYAIVSGIFENKSATISANIGRHPSKPEKMAVIENGKPSVTHYRVLEEFNNKYSLIEINLETGRTHQIRVHMSYTGHPIINDTLYGGTVLPVKTNEQALQAYSVTFVSPADDKQKHIEIGFDNDIIKALNYLRCTK